ncbi:MAG: CRTAC1 family protein, partial [Bacteroidota bacterium]
MADINQDGYTDILVFGVGGYKKFNGRNQVFLNNGDLTFREAAAELGLDFQGFSTQGIFLDADRDGDLDLYLLNHSVHTVRSMGNIDLRYQSNRSSGDKLYENRLVPEGTVMFREVTGSAGVFNSALGYGLGVGAADLNNDGATDLYVSNDFHENDYLYLGSGKGTFRQTAERSLGHTSRFSMGNEVADLNNDGRMDIITLDMLPWEEDIIKASAGEDPYDIFQYKLRLGFHHQYARNAFQLNTGNTTDGTPLFIDIAPFAGVEATDWSWAPLAADFDNDGWQDLFISNGILRRPNDMDYISFISTDSVQRNLTFGDYIRRMPEGKVPDRIFRNNGNLSFQDENGIWIEGKPDLSNGAAYSDLDNDGDLDLVVNTINEPAKVYRNRSDSSRYLQVKLEGPAVNRDAIGSTVILYQGTSVQTRQVQPVRGFQSSVTTRLQFGLGKMTPDSLAVQWPDGTTDIFRKPQPNSMLTITWKEGQKPADQSIIRNSTVPKLFTQLADGPVHHEDEFSAFSRERLLPHAVDAPGPATATGDFNDDGIDDVFVSAGAGKDASILLGSRNGSFRSYPLTIGEHDAAAALVLDANGDKRDDLLVVPGGQEEAGTPMLFLQQGDKLSRCTQCMPSITLNGSCAV